MQLAQSGTLENVELAGKLKIGGRWYGRASVVAVDEADAAVLKSRGIAVAAKRGAKPVNVAEEPARKVPVAEMPVVTRDTEAPTDTPVEATSNKDTGHGKRSDKRR
jgi:hypothetical protein